jgi:tetrahydromethanopterin S-methyltransferase subunit A
MANSDMLQHISIVGRLLSENKGIDLIIRHVNQNKKIKTIIVCGKEVWGHKAGHSLFKVYKNGIDNNRRIINSNSPDPFLTVTKSQITYFQNEINLVNMIDETNFSKIKQKIF